MSLSTNDVITILFALGILQTIALICSLEPIFTLIIIAVMTALLVRYRSKYPKTRMRDFLSFFFYKINGGIIYEPPKGCKTN